MNEFTKGEWVADDMGEYVFAHGFNMMICQIRGWAYLKAQGLSSDEAIDVQKANARLIAAAPEMCKIISSLAGFESCPHEAWPDQEYLLRDLCRRSSHVLTRIDGEEVRNNE